MKPLLRPGQLSVGVNVNVSHLAATPMGVTVRAEATFTGMQGKLYCFELNAWDKGGLIGQGSHTRAIIASERLLTGARARNESAPARRRAAPRESRDDQRRHECGITASGRSADSAQKCSCSTRMTSSAGPGCTL